MNDVLEAIPTDTAMPATPSAPTSEPAHQNINVSIQSGEHSQPKGFFAKLRSGVANFLGRQTSISITPSTADMPTPEQMLAYEKHVAENQRIIKLAQDARQVAELEHLRASGKITTEQTKQLGALQQKLANELNLQNQNATASQFAAEIAHLDAKNAKALNGLKALNKESLLHLGDVHTQTAAAKDAERVAEITHQRGMRSERVETQQAVDATMLEGQNNRQASALAHEKSVGVAKIDTAKGLDEIVERAQARLETHQQSLTKIESARSAARLKSQILSDEQKLKQTVKQGQATGKAIEAVGDAENNVIRNRGKANADKTNSESRANNNSVRTGADSDKYAQKQKTAAKTHDMTETARAAAEVRGAEEPGLIRRILGATSKNAHNEEAAESGLRVAKTNAQAADAPKVVAEQTKQQIATIESSALNTRRIASAKAGLKAAEYEAKAVSTLARAKNAGVAWAALGIGTAVAVGAMAWDIVRPKNDNKPNMPELRTPNDLLAMNMQQQYNNPVAQAQWAAMVEQQQAMNQGLQR